MRTHCSLKVRASQECKRHAGQASAWYRGPLSDCQSPLQVRLLIWNTQAHALPRALLETFRGSVKKSLTTRLFRRMHAYCSQRYCFQGFKSHAELAAQGLHVCQLAHHSCQCPSRSAALVSAFTSGPHTASKSTCCQAMLYLAPGICHTYHESSSQQPAAMLSSLCTQLCAAEHMGSL